MLGVDEKSYEQDEGYLTLEQVKEIYEQESKEGEDLSDLAYAYYCFVDQFLDVVENGGWEEWLKYYALERDKKRVSNLEKVCTFLIQGANAGLPGYEKMAKMFIKMKDLFSSDEIEYTCCGDIVCPDCLGQYFEDDDSCGTCGHTGEGQINIIDFLDRRGYRLEKEFNMLDIETMLENISDFFEAVESGVEKRYLLSSKPSIPISSMDSNIYNILGAAKKALIRRGKYKEADEMIAKVHQSGSYENALAIIMEYVDFE